MRFIHEGDHHELAQGPPKPKGKIKLDMLCTNFLLDVHFFGIIRHSFFLSFFLSYQPKSPLLPCWNF